MAAHDAVALELPGDPRPRAQTPHRLGDAAPEIEETLVERLQEAHGTGTLIRQHGQRSILRLQGGEPFGQRVERLVPGNTTPSTLAALEWMQDTIRAIDP